MFYVLRGIFGLRPASLPARAHKAPPGCSALRAATLTATALTISHTLAFALVIASLDTSVVRADSCSFLQSWDQQTQENQDAARVDKQLPASSCASQSDEKKALDDMLRQQPTPDSNNIWYNIWNNISQTVKRVLEPNVSKPVSPNNDPFGPPPIDNSSKLPAYVSGSNEATTPTPSTSGNAVKLNPVPSNKNIGNIGDYASPPPPPNVGNSYKYAPDRYAAPVSGFESQPQPQQYLNPDLVARSAPGGISLSKAAAARMPININLDGAYYKDGRLVLSGQADASSSFDAALFLTSLRAACEPTEPFFSLVPVDFTAWDAEGQSASEDLWRKISTDLNWDRKPAAKPNNTANSLIVRTFWARRDYPHLWNEISRSHPNFKARLVFRPEWLRQTRFGEILFKGDVLLKELSEGVPILGTSQLRAGLIAGYVSGSARHLARNLRSAFEKGPVEHSQPQWRSNRLWFDLVSPPPIQIDTATTVSAQPSREPKELANLESVMQRQGLIPLPVSSRPLERTIAKDGDTLDLTQIYPKMFVRRTKEGKDIAGSDPDLDGLSDDLNRNIEQYVAQYRELQVLSELFRAYVVAVQIINQNDDVCDRLDALPLLDSEKLSSPLPEYHPSELFITIGMYEFSVPNGRRLLSAGSRSASGGVSISGKSFSSMEMTGGGTLVTHNLNREISQHPKGSVWDADGRSFIAFHVDSDMPEIQDYIENEPPIAQLPK